MAAQLDSTMTSAAAHLGRVVSFSRLTCSCVSLSGIFTGPVRSMASRMCMCMRGRWACGQQGAILGSHDLAHVAAQFDGFG